jgi:hypothetical protein
MKFIINRPKESIVNLMRMLGYRPLANKGEEFNCQRRLRGTDYPRFHLYIKEDKNKLVFNLHLDQKKPSYAGSVAHSADYRGEVVKTEAERLKQMISRLK